VKRRDLTCENTE